LAKKKKGEALFDKSKFREYIKSPVASDLAKEAEAKLMELLYGREPESKEKYDKKPIEMELARINLQFRLNKKLNILHLSDLHFGKFNRHTGQIPYYKRIWEEIKKKLESNNIKVSDIDLVIITGDLSSTGNKIEFEHAHNFLNVLYEDLDKKKFIIIPGNHDLEYAEKEGMINTHRFDNYLQFKSMMGFKDEKKDSFNYLNNPHFIRTFDDPSTCVLCLNSCLHTTYESDLDYPTDFSRSAFKKSKEKISKIDKSQLISSLEALQSPDTYAYKLVLLHHNILGYNPERAFLYNFYYVISEIGDHLKSYLILHGHLHRRIMDRYQNCVTIGAGSFGVNDKYKDTKNQLNLIKINKHTSPFPYTEVNVLTLTIDYDESSSKAVKSERDWESEILEMPMSTFTALKSMDNITERLISKGDFKSSERNYEAERALISKSEIYNRDFLKKFIAHKHEKELRKLNPAFEGIDSIIRKATSEKLSKIKKDILGDRTGVSRSKF